ncbi:ANTAR domain-containing protein [Streptomyces sp. TG1A-8]|uniref:ANTAR domain-containing protein n=1 Tax=Streptomyces sp. TG1A-8 TaxID=3051385 RepID=UPI00265C755C|nr:ANTAR domain-containing protein [Streptomyces sp. TG1A-8]MDO0929113.1 ANTAR domain-containing protein [Streptomyces sp. TG1A-8]
MKSSPDRPVAPPRLVIEQSVVEGLSAEGALLLRMSGSPDPYRAEEWCEELRGHLERADRAGLRPVLDMAHVQLGGAAALRTLGETARSRAGRPDLIVVRARPGVREAVHLAGLDGVRLYATLEEALQELARAAAPVEDLPAWRSQIADQLSPSYEDLHKEVRALRARVRTAPVIGMAQGTLMTRYGLPDSGTAFRVLRETSQRFNVPLRVLVSAVVAARPPDGEVWFPGRRPLPVPPLRFLLRGGTDPRCRRRMTDAVLHGALAAGRAAAGYVRFVDPAVDALVLETHHGCAETFLDHLVRGGREEGTADAAARTERRQVSVPDVRATPLLTDDSRRVLLAAGVRALQSIPVVSPAGPCTGVITLHWPDAGHRPSAERAGALGLLAGDTAVWLSWYHRSVLLDALEHVHRTLTRPGPGTRRCAPPGVTGEPGPRTQDAPPATAGRMSDPQQPGRRRGDKGGATPQGSGELRTGRPAGGTGGRPRGQDRGGRGGGGGGGVPQAQWPGHP